MSNSATRSYPPEAYAETGELWWKLKTYPGTRRKYGVENRLMAWLAFNRQVGDLFTTKEARAVLGKDDVPNNDEHFQRRVRQLRKYGWDLPSNKYDRNLPAEHYRVDSIGWHPGLGSPRPKSKRVSTKLQREVFNRDGWRCVVCGRAGGDPYDDGTLARLTAGHALADEFGGAPTLDNLRTECSRCNEPIRNDGPKPESLEEVMTGVRGLKNRDLLRLGSWLAAGTRPRDQADIMFDRIRQLPEGRKQEVIRQLAAMTKH